MDNMITFYSEINIIYLYKECFMLYVCCVLVRFVCCEVFVCTVSACFSSNVRAETAA